MAARAWAWAWARAPKLRGLPVRVQLGQLPRLFTREDGAFFHAHKVCGALVLLHFAYRAYLWATVGALQLERDPWLPLWALVHALLNVTSFQFHLSPRRNRTYNIIWPEGRWHTLVFSFRSIVALLVGWAAHEQRAFPWLPRTAADALRLPIVLATMALADAVTAHYKASGAVEHRDSTMRGNPFPAWVPPGLARAHNLFYSASQVLGTLNILVRRDLAAAFLPLVPIQTAPFCMTLVRKGVIDQLAWHVLYTAALLSNYAYYWTTSEPERDLTPLYATLATMFCVARFEFGANKYVLWIVVAALCV